MLVAPNQVTANELGQTLQGQMAPLHQSSPKPNQGRGKGKGSFSSTGKGKGPMNKAKLATPL